MPTVVLKLFARQGWMDEQMCQQCILWAILLVHLWAYINPW